MKRFLIFLAAAFSAVCSADFALDFGKTKNPLDDLTFSVNTPAAVKDKTVWSNGVLKVNGSWAQLYKEGETFTNGRVSLSGQDRFRSSAILIARAKKDFGAYYALEITPFTKKIRFYRYMFPKLTVIKEFSYDGARAYTLDMDFNGKTIIPRVNGKVLGEFPDDGQLKSGVVGARLGYWADMHLLKLSAQAALPAAAPKAAPKPAAAPEKTAQGDYVYNFSIIA